MDYLSSLAVVLEKNQQQEFRNKLRKESRSDEPLDLKLFDLLLDDSVDDPGEKLYKKKGDPAYHTLRKRLSQKLIDFIVLKRMEVDKTSTGAIMGIISLAEHFIDQGLVEQGWYYLNKAEERAEEGEYFDLLNRIYLNKIEQFNQASGEDLNEIIRKKQRSKKLQDEDERVVIACSLIKNELRKTIMEGRDVNFDDVTSLILTSYDLNDAVIERPRVLFNILTISRSVILAKKDFHSFEPYIIEKYQEVLRREGFRRKDLFYELSILYMIAHVLYRNRKFEEAKHYLNTLTDKSSTPGSKHFRQFYARSVMLMAAILSYSGELKEAIEVLQTAINNYPESFTTSDLAKLKLNLAIYYFQDGDISKAIRVNREIGKTDRWYEKHMGKEWVFKKSLMEIIAQIEIGNSEIALNMIRAFERRYKDMYSHPLYVRAKAFVELIRKMIQDPFNFRNEDFLRTIENQLVVVPEEQEDLQAMAFYAWIKAKVSKKEYYEVLLETVR